MQARFSLKNQPLAASIARRASCLFGPEGRLRLVAGAQDMKLQNENLGQGRRTRFNLLPPPTEATAADGTQPGAVAGWRQMEEAEVSRAPLPIPSRDVVSRYFRALLAGR